METRRFDPISLALPLAGAAACMALLTLYYVGPLGAVGFLVSMPAAFVLPAVAIQAKQAIGTFARQSRWWHFAWISLSLSTLTFRARDIDTIRNSPIDGWAAYRIGLVVLVAILLLYHFDVGHLLSSVFRGGALGMMGLYCVVALASSIWSVFPSWTAYKSFEFSVDVCMLAGILILRLPGNSLKTLFDSFWLYLGLLLAAVFAGVIIWPQEALARGVGMLGIQIVGVVPSWSSNGVGDLSGTLGLVALTRLQTRGWKCAHRSLYSAVLVVCLITLIFAQTRSAILGMAAGAVVVLLMSKRIGMMGWLIAGVAALAFFAGNTAITYMTRDQNTELLMSLTGRTTWWEAALVRIADHPIIGYGAYAGARFVALADLGNGTTSTIHNTYLDALIGTGLIGLLPLMAALIWTWVHLARLLIGRTLAVSERHLGIEAMALLAMMTVRSFFTSNFIYHAPLDFFLVIGFVEFHRHRISSRVRSSYSGYAR